MSIQVIDRQLGDEKAKSNINETKFEVTYFYSMNS